MRDLWMTLVAALPLFAACRLDITRALEAGDLRGQVVLLEAGSETPLEGATVAVAGTRLLARTDARGRFVVRGLVPGTYDVGVSFDPPAGDPIGLRVRGVSLAALGNGRADAKDLGKLVAGRVGALQVTVREGEAPLAGAKVSVEGIGEIVCDASGQGRLGRLVPGPVSLVVTHEDATRRAWGTQEATIVAATVTDVTVQVSQLAPLVAGSVTGTAEQLGNPDRAGFTVQLVDGTRVVDLGGTDVDGRFTASAVPPGAWTIVVTAPDGTQLRHGPVIVNGDVDLGTFLLLTQTGDRDHDGLPDGTDPCPDLYGDGGDADTDGIGDACDPDFDPTPQVATTLELTTTEVGGVTAGDAFDVMLRVLDQDGAVMERFTGPIDVTSDDPRVGVFGSKVFDGGAGEAAVSGRLETAGVRVLAASSGVLSARLELSVVAGPAARVDAVPESSTVGAGEPVGVFARLSDAFGNPVTGVQPFTFDSDDPTAVADPEAGAFGGAAEVRVLATFHQAGARALWFVSDGLSSGPGTIEVAPAAPASFGLQVLDPPLVSGTPEPIRLVPVDAFGNDAPVTSPLRVSFDDAAIPAQDVADVTFSFTPQRAGPLAIVVDVPSDEGFEPAVLDGLEVLPGARTKLAFVGAGDVGSGSVGHWTVRLEDAAGNPLAEDGVVVSMSYTGTGTVTGPSSVVLSGGVASLELTGVASGPVTVTASAEGLADAVANVAVGVGPFDRIVEFGPVGTPVAFTPVELRARAVDVLGVTTPDGAGDYRLLVDDADATLEPVRFAGPEEMGGLVTSAVVRTPGSRTFKLLRNGVVVATATVSVADAPVSLQTFRYPDGVTADVVPVEFHLRCDVERTVDLRVEVSRDGTNWSPASLVNTVARPVAGLLAGPSGASYEHAFEWAAARDVPAGSTDTWRLRITPWAHRRAVGSGVHIAGIERPSIVRVGAPVVVATHADVVSTAVAAASFSTFSDARSLVLLNGTTGRIQTVNIVGTTASAPQSWVGSGTITGVGVRANPDPTGPGAFVFATFERATNRVSFYTSSSALPQTVALINAPTDLAFADLDRDGDMDAVIGSGSARANWLRNDRGSFNLQAMTLANGGTGTHTVVGLADFRGDGFKDAIFGFDATNGFVELRPNTRAAVLPLADWQNINGLTTPTRAVLPGRFDGEARDDLVLVRDGSMQMLSGSATGTPLARGVVTAGGTVVASAAGDIDGDGFDDVALAFNDGSVRYWPGDATSSTRFKAPQTLVAATGVAPVSIALGDFARDGTLDLVVSTATESTLYPVETRRLPNVHLDTVSLGEATVTTPHAIAVFRTPGGRPSHVVTTADGDLRSYAILDDGRLDEGVQQGSPALDGMPATLLPPRRTPLGAVGAFGVVPGASRWTIVPVPTNALGSSAFNVAGALVDATSADFDRDGTDDLVVLARSPSAVKVVRNDGADVADVDAGVVTSPRWVSAGDFDCDGDADVLVHDEAGLPWISLARDDGTFPPLASLPAAVSSTRRPLVADFDRDGCADVRLDDAAQDVVVRRGGPTPFANTFGMNAASSGGVMGQAVPIDYDGDGDLDLVVHHVEPGGMSYKVFQVAGPLFSLVESLPARLAPAALAAADADGDGREDLVVLRADGRVELHRAGLAGFQRDVRLSEGIDFRNARMIDVLANGAVDVVSSVAAGTEAEVLRNTPGALQWTAATQKPLLPATDGSRVLDFNVDGVPDLVSRVGTNVHVLAGDRASSSRFSVPVSLDVNAPFVGPAIADFQQRGVPDMVVARATGLTSIENNSGGGPVAIATGPTSSVPAGLTPVLLTEWHAAPTGPPSLALVASGTLNELRRCERTTGLVFDCSTPGSTFTGSPLSIAKGRLDSDLREDLVIGTEIVTLLALAAATGFSFAPIPGAPGAARLALVDLDGDGDLDLVGSRNDPAASIWTMVQNEDANGVRGGFSGLKRYGPIEGAATSFDVNPSPLFGSPSVLVGGQAGTLPCVLRLLQVAGRRR